MDLKVSVGDVSEFGASSRGDEKSFQEQTLGTSFQGAAGTWGLMLWVEKPSSPGLGGGRASGTIPDLLNPK